MVKFKGTNTIHSVSPLPLPSNQSVSQLIYERTNKHKGMLIGEVCSLEWRILAWPDNSECTLSSAIDNHFHSNQWANFIRNIGHDQIDSHRLAKKWTSYSKWKNWTFTSSFSNLHLASPIQAGFCLNLKRLLCPLLDGAIVRVVCFVGSPNGWMQQVETNCWSISINHFQ